MLVPYKIVALYYIVMNVSTILKLVRKIMICGGSYILGIEIATFLEK
ncbi:hypothetical protein [Leptospira kirschneri]|uniref:Uncharacterized protein n=2 Tax=Leptospira kirschneri TaxID=29507 RepID=A0A0E2B7C0_9LEPT|nr:hypothetical protein [Leptospira kirschneri]EKO17084.1 hypothetical protein LEP1GSC081_4356 [Leptospira kirschneri str. H1]EKO60067.1 hypothetical protein LEP1GSC082_3670 [Leptospira kirschneri str. H2]EMK25862.1 hypothetical protein LEP1GSC008_2346 [Leptospira kirschneri serovar Bulgarica str. Nikolaevo]